MELAAIHGALGMAVLVMALLLALGAALVFAAGDRPAGARLGRLVDATWVVTLVAAALAFILGPLLLATGRVLADPLHALYGVAALASLPLATVVGIARSTGPGHHPSRYAWVTGGALVMAALAFLLEQSG